MNRELAFGVVGFFLLLLGIGGLTTELRVNELEASVRRIETAVAPMNAWMQQHGEDYQEAHPSSYSRESREGAEKQLQDCIRTHCAEIRKLCMALDDCAFARVDGGNGYSNYRVIRATPPIKNSSTVSGEQP